MGRRNDDVPITLGARPLGEVIRFVQEIVTDAEAWGPDVAAEHRWVLEEAQARDPEAGEKTQELVLKVFDRYGVEVKGMDKRRAAFEVYKAAWGLDLLEELYRDRTVDEIRVDRPDMVTVQRQGKNEFVPARFKDEEHIRNIAARLLSHDRGVALTASTPTAESVLKDGSRLTATCPPVTDHWTLVLRKHNTFEMTPENLIRAGTLDEPLLELLATLVRGRANIMISGGIGSGKTSLLRFLVGYLPESLRIVTLENDRELRLGERYPGRSVVEMEEHPEIGMKMDRLFRTVLRYTPDVIIAGEVRGRGEATEAVKACTRGHDGSMATIHFSSPEEAVTGFGKMMLEEGLNLPIDIAVSWVAEAFDVVVQMFADTTRGIKKITRVTEIGEEGGAVSYRDLAVWQPSAHDFFEGRWAFPHTPGQRLLAKMHRYGVPQSELKQFHKRQQERRAAV